MLHCLDFHLKGWPLLPGDNLGMLQSSTLVESQLKKKHVAIGYHKLRECVAAGTVNPIKVDTRHNIADFLTKSLAWKELHYLPGPSLAGGTMGQRSI